MRALFSALGLAGEYFRLGILKALEYRTSTLSQLFGIFLNDTLWLVFWVFYFKRFPVMQGWTLQDVVVLWSSVTLCFGMVEFLMANVTNLSQMVQNGMLDNYLIMPRNVLFHVSVSSSNTIALADIIFSVVVFALFVDLTPARVGVFALTSILAMGIMYGFALLVNSLAFFVGSSETLANQLGMFLLHFSTYPLGVFDKVTRFVLLTVLPAGLISSYPVEIVRSFSWTLLGHMALAAVVFVVLGVCAFQRGLKRYESGNALSLRSR